MVPRVFRGILQEARMVILSFLTQLFGATFLLLFAVRMVRTGIERAYGPWFRRMMTSGNSPLHQAPLGIVMAIVLQSSAAVTVLVAGFAGGGVVSFAPGIAMVLGGDLGSALLIQVLSLRHDWLSPLLLVIGGVLFLKTERRALRQAGRIVLGIALILISLDLLRDTMEPIRDSNFLPAIASYLERDYVTAFIAGATLAFVMHSSVATILMCVAVVGIGALPMSVGISLVLGANLGSALIPVWLCRDYSAQARRIPVANLVIRGSAAALALFVLNSVIAVEVAGRLDGAHGLILLHIVFNATLLVLIPACHLLERPMAVLFPDPVENSQDFVNPQFRSVLTDKSDLSPEQALAYLRREVLRMAGILEEMLSPVMDLYADSDPQKVKSINEQDEVINSALDGIRRFSASLPEEALSKKHHQERRALVDYGIALEAAGDIIVKRLLPLAGEMHKDKLRFSEAGRDELEDIHRRVTENLATATNVLVSGDVESARVLLENKAEMAKVERRSRKNHLSRLDRGEVESFATSDRHVETAYLLKEFNSWVTTVAHPILAREGELLDTRLVKASDL